MKRVIDLARAAVESGALEEITHAGDSRPRNRQLAFAELPANGPWPDTIAFSFKCTGCGERFQFGADTFRGGGGEWTRTTGPR